MKEKNKFILYIYFLLILTLIFLFSVKKVSSYIFFTGIFSSALIVFPWNFFRNAGEFPVSFLRKFFLYFFTFLYFFFITGFFSLILSFSGVKFLSLQPIVFSTFILFCSHFLYTSLPTGIPPGHVIRKNFIYRAILVLIFSEISLFLILKLVKKFGGVILTRDFRYFFVGVGIFIFVVQLGYYLSNFRLKKTEKSLFSDKPLVVIGLDAADWRFISPLLKRNRLPFLGKLIKNGLSLPIDTFGRRLSPSIWTSIATGTEKGKHGITGFINSGGEKPMELFKSHDIKKPPFWLMANEMGRRSCVLNWMMNYPAYILDGFMVGRFDGFKDKFNYYPEEIMDEFSDFSEIENRKFHGEKIEEKWLFERDKDLEILKGVLTKAMKLIEMENIDIMAFYTNLTDDLMHKFYQFYDKKRFDSTLWHFEEGDVKKYKKVIFETYRLVDKIFDELIDINKFNVLLVSDHGARPRNFPLYSFNMDEFLKDFGFNNLYVVDNTIWNTHMDLRTKDGRIDESVKRLCDIKVGSGKNLFSKVKASPEGGVDIRVFHSFYSRFPYDVNVTCGDVRYPLKKYLNFVNMASGNHDPQGVMVVCGEGIRKKFLLPLLKDNPISKIVNISSLEERVKKILPLFTTLRHVGILNPLTTVDVTPLIHLIMGIPLSVDFDFQILFNIFEDGVSEELVKPMQFSSEIYPVVEVEDLNSDEIYKNRLRDLGYIE